MSAEHGIVCGSLSPSITLHISTSPSAPYSSYCKTAKYTFLAALGGFGIPRIRTTASAKDSLTNGERPAGFRSVFVPLVIFRPTKSGKSLYLLANLTLELPCKCFASSWRKVFKVYDVVVNLKAHKKGRAKPSYLDWEFVRYEQD
jgi:hypothetical protein